MTLRSSVATVPGTRGPRHPGRSLTRRTCRHGSPTVVERGRDRWRNFRVLGLASPSANTLSVPVSGRSDQRNINCDGGHPPGIEPPRSWTPCVKRPVRPWSTVRTAMDPAMWPWPQNHPAPGRWFPADRREDAILKPGVRSRGTNGVSSRTRRCRPDTFVGAGVSQHERGTAAAGCRQDRLPAESAELPMARTGCAAWTRSTSP